jgi:hypothetical protein
MDCDLQDVSDKPDNLACPSRVRAASKPCPALFSATGKVDTLWTRLGGSAQRLSRGEPVLPVAQRGQQAKTVDPEADVALRVFLAGGTE